MGDKRVTENLCISHVNVDCFKSSFFMGIGNNYFASSTALYQILEIYKDKISTTYAEIRTASW